jgi:hypothetical protein
LASIWAIFLSQTSGHTESFFCHRNEMALRQKSRQNVAAKCRAKSHGKNSRLKFAAKRRGKNSRQKVAAKIRGKNRGKSRGKNRGKSRAKSRGGCVWRPKPERAARAAQGVTFFLARARGAAFLREASNPRRFFLPTNLLLAGPAKVCV